MIIYELEDRGMQFFYHWFVYILGGLRHIEKHDVKTIIYMPWFKEWHDYEKDSLEYFSDCFIFLLHSDDLKQYKDATIIRHHGEPLLSSDTVHSECFIYLREKFTVDKDVQVDKQKYIFLRRNNTHLLPQTGKTSSREIINEKDIFPLLSRYNIQIVDIVRLTLKEKIRLFQTSRMIMGVWSGGFTLSFCASPETLIIDFYPKNWPHGYNHYMIMCQAVSVPYLNFNDIYFATDGGDVCTRNMMIDVPAFEKFLQLRFQQQV